MGIDHFTWPNLINFLLYFVFLFLMSTLTMNIFTGIAINEIQSLINDSNIEIMKEKIEYLNDIREWGLNGESDGFKCEILNKMITKYNKIMKSYYKIVRGVLDRIENFVKHSYYTLINLLSKKIKKVFKIKDENNQKKDEGNKDHSIEVKQAQVNKNDKYQELLDKMDHILSKIDSMDQKMDQKFNLMDQKIPTK